MILRRIFLRRAISCLVFCFYYLRLSILSFKMLYFLSVSSIIFLMKSILQFSSFIWLLSYHTFTSLLRSYRYCHSFVCIWSVLRQTFDTFEESIYTFLEFNGAGPHQFLTITLETFLGTAEWARFPSQAL